MYLIKVLLCLLIGSIVIVASTEIDQNDECRHDIVESMPDKLSFNGSLNFTPTLTHEALIEIINNAKQTLRIASFYWTLTSEPQFASHPSTEPGRKIMEALDVATKRGVNLQVILDHSSRKEMSNQEDMDKLRKLGSLKFLNMTRLLKSGILHSKFMIADNETFYMGSSNFDWRSYTQIKEIGIRFTNCKTLAQDLDKIFRTYEYFADLNEVTDRLPEYLETKINADNPLKMTLDNLGVKMFLGAAPPAFNGAKIWSGRTDDIDGLLRVLNNSRRRLDISVMNYSPRTEFIWPKKFWPRIDDALRRAASERAINVRLLFSNWTQNKEEELMWYRSLNAVQSKTLRGGGIHVKLFKVPAYDEFQESIPYARVKHDKYMVTDRGLYIGTSNWSPDYFINTCGVGMVIEPDSSEHEVLASEGNSIIKNMQDLFDRDFNSQYAQELPAK